MKENTLCFQCGLPDCYPTDPRCPVLKEKSERKGISLPDVSADAPVRFGVRKFEGLVPETFTDKADYQKQYHAKYNSRFKKILLRVFLKREDIALLRGVYGEGERKLETAVADFLEYLVKKAREKKNVDSGERS